jgi:hypothetical protein
MTYTCNLLFGPALPSYTKSGSKWQSGLNSGIFIFWAGPGNRSYWGVFDHLFPDNGFTGTEPRITDFNGRKTGLFIPFWLANLFPDGLEDGETGKRPVLGMPVFWDLVLWRTKGDTFGS